MSVTCIRTLVTPIDLYTLSSTPYHLHRIILKKRTMKYLLMSVYIYIYEVLIARSLVSGITLS